MKNLSDKEKIIQFLIDKYNKKDFCMEDQIAINYENIESMNISPEEAYSILCSLDNDSMIFFKFRDPDFNAACRVIIYSKLLQYFAKIKEENTTNRREFVRTYFPVGLSLCSVIISLISLIISIIK